MSSGGIGFSHGHGLVVTSGSVAVGYSARTLIAGRLVAGLYDGVWSRLVIAPGS